MWSPGTSDSCSAIFPRLPGAGGRESGRRVYQNSRDSFPDIPTIAEASVCFAVAGWFMLTAPAKTPRPVIEKLHGELKSSLATPEAKEQIVKLSLLPMDTPSVEEMQSSSSRRCAGGPIPCDRAGSRHRNNDLLVA